MGLHVSVKSYEHEKKYRMMYTKLHTKNVSSYIDGLQSGGPLQLEKVGSERQRNKKDG